jgi:hypothetical protein
MINDWDNMPKEYFDHISDCQLQDADGTARNPVNTCKSIIGWAHKSIAVMVGLCRIPGACVAHKRIFKKCRRVSKRNVPLMKEYRARIKVCERCGESRATETHHIVPVCKGGADVEENYMAVCLSCHRSLHPDLPVILFTRRTPCLC